MLVYKHVLRLLADVLTVPELPSEIHLFLMPIRISRSFFEQYIDIRKCSIQQYAQIIFMITKDEF